MGILSSLSRAGTSCCIRITVKKHPRVLRIVKPEEEKMPESSSSILARDIPANIAVFGARLIDESSWRLPPDMRRRIKVVITKQQLRLLLDRRIPVEEAFPSLNGKQTHRRGDGSAARTWRPSLETIAEESTSLGFCSAVQ